MSYIPPYEGQQLACTVLRIERSSIHDGAGFRTVVFFKGCPLRCQWCSTPESQSKQIETTKDGEKNYGQVMSVEDILREVRKDIPFYFHSGGGMTLSGGEALSQHTAVAALLRQAGIPTVGGMDMLVQQAACAQEIWYGAQFSEADLAALTRQAQAQLARQEAHP